MTSLRNTMRQSTQLWNSQSPECRTTSQRDPNYFDTAMCAATLTRKRLRWCPKTISCEYLADLAWSRLGVEPAEVSDNPSGRKMLGVLLGAAVSANLHRSKRGWKGMNKTNENILSIFYFLSKK